MERFGLYDKLTSIPLFMGMSRHELEQIISKTKFNFRKVAEGEIVVRQGNKCGFLAMLIDGSVETIASADDYAYEVHEFLSGPMVLQFDGIFGRMQLFTRTYKAASPCNFIILDKNEVLNLASNSFSFAFKASKCALYSALFVSISLSNSRLAAAIFCFISSSSSVFRAKFTSTSAPQLPHFTLLCIYSLVFIFSNSSCTVAEFGSLLILSIASP